MLKWLVRFVALLAFLDGKSTKVNRVLEGPGLRILFHRPRGVINNSMTNIAVVSHDLAVIAHVLAVMTTESERLGSAGTIVA